MKLERVEIVHVEIPLVTPFRTSFGTMTTKDTFLLHVVTDAAEGRLLEALGELRNVGDAGESQRVMRQDLRGSGTLGECFAS